MYKMPCATKTRKNGSKYQGCWDESPSLARQSSIPMSMPMNISNDGSALSSLMLGMNPQAPPLQRTTSYQARRRALMMGGDMPDDIAVARRNMIGAPSPFIHGYGAIPNIGGGVASGRIDTSGSNVGLAYQHPVRNPNAKKKSEETRGTYTKKWDKKNPPRHLVKQGQVGIFSATSPKKYVVMSKNKALEMVKTHMSANVYKTFNNRLTNPQHNTYVDWEIHTSNKAMLALFNV